jgi:outer membrane protein OmpA-like peptidoglycan-associated protein
MSADGEQSYRRYRRRILGWGAVALVAVFAVGSIVSLTRVEDDLEGQVVDQLDHAGIAGVRVSFSGQDGRLACTTPLPDGEAVVDAGMDVRGVRRLELDDSCVAAGRTGVGSDGDRSELVPADQTVLELIATDPQFSALDQAVRAAGLAALTVGAEPYTAFAPSNEAFEALTPAEAGALNADPELITKVLENHVVAEQLSVAELPEGPLTMLGGDEVIVHKGAGPDGPVTLTSGDVTATVIDPDLVLADGTVHVVDRLLIPEGLDLVADAVGAGPSSTVAEAQGAGSADDPGSLARRSAALQIDLAGVVRATPIGFAPDSTEVSALSGPTLDRVAAAIEARPGVTVVVRGHTDSGNSDLANLYVSTARAEAVVDALVARGVPAERLRAEGLGATEPVLVDGVEDPVASRRVDFAVETE